VQKQSKAKKHCKNDLRRRKSHLKSVDFQITTIEDLRIREKKVFQTSKFVDLVNFLER